MMKRLSFALTFCMLVSASSLTASRAAIPPFASYFSGTWTCTTKGGSFVVKAYGADASGDALLLHNDFDSPTGYIASINESYTQAGAVSTVISELNPEIVYVGTSSGFENDALVFNGTANAPNGSRFQRMTYTRTDKDHFTRVFESGATATSPLTEFSNETCTRVATAPVPTPNPAAR